MSNPPSIVRLVDGEEFEYYVKFEVYWNPGDGSWRLVSKPEFADDPRLVKELLLKVACDYGTEREGEAQKSLVQNVEEAVSSRTPILRRTSPVQLRRSP